MGAGIFQLKEVQIDLYIYPNQTLKPSEIYPLLFHVELNYSVFFFQHLLFYLNSVIESYKNTGSVFSNINEIELPCISPTKEILLPALSLGVKVIDF